MLPLRAHGGSSEREEHLGRGETRVTDGQWRVALREEAVQVNHKGSWLVRLCI